MELYSLLSDRNTHLLVRRSIVFHNNWLFYVFEECLLELLKQFYQDLVSINCRVDLLFLLQFGEYIQSHSTLSKCPPEHHSSTHCTFSVIDTIKVKLLAIPFLYPVPGTAPHSHFDIYFIGPNKYFPIFNSEISMALGQLKMTLLIEFLEKESVLGYSIIVAKVIESIFELSNANVKLEILNDSHSG